MHDKPAETFEPEHACAAEIYAFNKCQTKDKVEKLKQHCEDEANALRACEIARRRREKSTKLYQDCIKGGGDALDCLKKSKE